MLFIEFCAAARGIWERVIPRSDSAAAGNGPETALYSASTGRGYRPSPLTMPPSGKNTDFEARLYRAKRNRACDSCRKRKGECGNASRTVETSAE